MLLVVLLPLLNQWIDETVRVTDDIRVYKYDGDTRAMSVGKEIIINTNLSASNPLLANPPTDKLPLVITTYEIFNSRHSAKALTKWRIKDGWTQSGARNMGELYDPKWPAGLRMTYRLQNRESLSKTSSSKSIRK